MNYEQLKAERIAKMHKASVGVVCPKCGYQAFWTSGGNYLNPEFTSTSEKAVCMTCNTEYLLVKTLQEIPVPNTRDAGPSAFGGRTRGTDRERI